MTNSPGTVSKILWHFTGGPKWNNTLSRQNTELKPVSEAVDNLIQIMESKKLKASSYREVFRGQYNFMDQPAVRSFGSIVNEYFDNHKNDVLGKEIVTSQVVCLADIPIQHLKYHAQRYGQVAIGFKREAIVREGFNPVLYSLENSQISKSLTAVYQDIAYLREYRLKHGSGNFMYDSFKIPEVIAELRRIEESVVRIASQVKSLKNDEFDSIYCEREWRKTADFQFGFDDVAMIIAPEKGDFFRGILNRLPNLPRTIPVCSWEQLIDH